MKKYLLILGLCVWSSLVSKAQDNNPHWFRYSAISPDGQKIVFTYKGDLFLVSVTGGDATPLTVHEAHDFMPVWSPDGREIAFASDRFGNFDVFVMPAEGGTAKRLTFHSNSEYPYCFSADGKQVILGGLRQDAVNHRQFPDGSQPEVYRVSKEGGMVYQHWTIPAEDIQMSKDGKKMIYHDKKGGENAWRKHHQSAITRDIWLFEQGKEQHTQLTNFSGEDRNPVFADNDQTVYYLSEESGSFNVHQFSLANPQQKQQVTQFKKHPVRYLSISQTGVLCFSFNGELYTLAKGGQPNKLKINIRLDDKKNNMQIIPISGNVREMAVSPNGKEIAYIVRGEVFVSLTDGSATKRITNTAQQERFVSFSPDGNSLLFAREMPTGWQIFQTQKIRKEEPYFYASTLLKEERLLPDMADAYQPQYSPDGKEIAFIENRRSLKVYNLASKQVRTLLTPNELFYMADGDQYFRWSPDSKWILAEYSPVMANTEVVMLAADGSQKMQNLTESGYTDYSPKWVNGGKQMLWFSNRDGLRSYANSGSRQADVYMMFFNQEAYDRFKLSKEDFALLKEAEEKAEKEKKDESKTDKDKKKPESKKDSTLKIQWEGLRERKAKLTIHSSYLGDATLSKDGEKLFYLARFEKGLNLWSTNLRTRETKMELALDANSGRLEWDKGMKTLFLLSDGRLFKINPEGFKREPINIQNELNLDIEAERKSMFEHVWSRTKTMFYISNMHQADWNALKETYGSKIGSIGTGYEFSELLSEMLGELNVSHCGSSYRATIPNADNTASLGILIDYDYTGEGLKIAEILQGSPMDTEKNPIKMGFIIEKIDGEMIRPDQDYVKFLNRKAGKLTLIEAYDPATKNKVSFALKPISLGEENGLLYRRWVRKNQDEVERLSKGALGYVHIPGMSDGPYRNVYEEVMGKYHDKKGIIIDTRFNGGGDLVSDLAMFFTGQKFLDYAIESRSVGYEPTFRWTKPSVAMVNEDNYSDGHCFACGYQDLGIGKMIGMPVPGTCSFAGWELLQDETTFWGTVPVSAKNKKGEWLENNQTVPDILQKNEFHLISKGKDQQLERAIEELMKAVK